MFGDIYNIRKRIKSVSKRFDVKYAGEGNYTVTQNGIYFMSIPHADLNASLLDKIREVVWKNENADILKEIEENNLKIELTKERERKDLAECMAKDIRPYVNKLR